MAAFADGVVGILTDAGYFVFLLSEGECVADNNVAAQLARRMLDDHLSEVGMCALVQ